MISYLLTFHSGLPRWSIGKESACQCKRCRRCGFNHWVRKIPWRRKGNPLQYSCPENSVDRGAWQVIVHGVAKSWTQLSTGRKKDTRIKTDGLNSSLYLHYLPYRHTHAHTHTLWLYSGLTPWGRLPWLVLSPGHGAHLWCCTVNVQGALTAYMQWIGISCTLFLHTDSAAAAAAKSLQSCPTLCDPRYGSPPGFPVPGILQARTLEWVAISFSNAWKWSHSVMSNS